MPPAKVSCEPARGDEADSRHFSKVRRPLWFLSRFGGVPFGPRSDAGQGEGEGEGESEGRPPLLEETPGWVWRNLVIVGVFVVLPASDLYTTLSSANLEALEEFGRSIGFRLQVPIRRRTDPHIVSTIPKKLFLFHQQDFFLLNVHDMMIVVHYLLTLAAARKKTGAISKFFEDVSFVFSSSSSSFGRLASDASHRKCVKTAKKFIVGALLVIAAHFWPFYEYNNIMNSGESSADGFTQEAIGLVAFYLRPVHTVLVLWSPAVTGTLLLSIYMTHLLAECFELLPGAVGDRRGDTGGSARAGGSPGPADRVDDSQAPTTRAGGPPDSPVRVCLTLCRAVRALNSATWPFLLLCAFSYMSQLVVMMYSTLGVVTDKTTSVDSGIPVFTIADRFAFSFVLSFACKLALYMFVLFTMFSAGQRLEDAR